MFCSEYRIDAGGMLRGAGTLYTWQTVLGRVEIWCIHLQRSCPGRFGVEHKVCKMRVGLRDECQAAARSGHPESA